LYLERQSTALRPSTNFLINKYPHLSVVLIFKEQCRRSNERGALYRPHSLGQGEVRYFLSSQRRFVVRSEARILQAFYFRSRGKFNFVFLFAACLAR
jgi:cupin superfamily acireductone dioxygenase involved in methionine salvage